MIQCRLGQGVTEFEDCEFGSIVNTNTSINQERGMRLKLNSKRYVIIRMSSSL